MPKSFLIAIVYCLFWNSVSVSQISIRSAYNESAAEALTKSDFEKAEKLYRLAIKEAGSLGIPDDTQIESILGLSEILLDTDRIPEARQMLDGALKAFEKRVQARKTYDTFYSKLTELLSRRTRLHLWDNEVAEARSRYQHWIELMEAEFESRFDFKFASLIEDYSQLCEENGDFSEVEKVYEKWISIASAQESPDPHDLAEIKMELASHYLRN